MKKRLATLFLCITLCLVSYKTSHAQVISTGKSIVRSPRHLDTSYSKQPFQLTIMLLASTANTSPVSLRVSVKNTGKSIIYYFTKGYAKDFRFIVTDQYGHDVQLTEFGQQTLMPSKPAGPPDYTALGIESTSMNVSVPLKSGMEDLSEIPIGELFDLSHLGVYSINVTMANYGEDHFAPRLHTPAVAKPLMPLVIRSNTLKIRHDVKGFSLDTSKSK